MTMFAYKLTTPEQDRALETLIDECGLARVLDAIGVLADDKAEHIRSNYDHHDRDATMWQRAGSQTQMLAARIESW
jgi:hypothetical protein